MPAHAAEDTIVAIATPPGPGGLGVVRLSGATAVSIASDLFSSSVPLRDALSHTLHHGRIVAGADVVDDAVAAVFRAPRSYTGEDVVEFSCHGSPAVLARVVRLALEAGARMAGPGEFTQRAYLNGKIDLAQAEAVAQLVSARSEAQRAAAVAQLTGLLSERVRTARGAVIDLFAQIEGNLDFTDGEVPPVGASDMQARLHGALALLDALAATGPRGRLLREGARVVFAGRPNAGKSSLFNAFLAQDRAIVTEHPGTTRDTLEEAVDWAGLPVVLVDTAGLRDTDDAVEKIGLTRARRAVDEAAAVVVVLDGTAPFSPDDEAVLASTEGRPRVVAVNKLDAPAHPAAVPPAQASAVRVSARTGEGLGRLRSAVLALFAAAPEAGDPVAIVNERHAEALRLARTRIAAALDAARAGRGEEAVALELREAAARLGELTGEDAGDDVLASVFRRFCIGK